MESQFLLKEENFEEEAKLKKNCLFHDVLCHGQKIPTSDPEI